MNLYTFSLNNPVRYVDPNGLKSTATTTSGPEEIDTECPPGLGDCGYKSIEITDIGGYDSDKLNEEGNALLNKASGGASVAWYSFKPEYQGGYKLYGKGNRRKKIIVNPIGKAWSIFGCDSTLSCALMVGGGPLLSKGAKGIRAIRNAKKASKHGGSMIGIVLKDGRGKLSLPITSHQKMAEAMGVMKVAPQGLGVRGTLDDGAEAVTIIFGKKLFLRKQSIQVLGSVNFDGGLMGVPTWAKKAAIQLFRASN